jgi:hypothetical protein
MRLVVEGDIPNDRYPEYNKYLSARYPKFGEYLAGAVKPVYPDPCPAVPDPLPSYTFWIGRGRGSNLTD